MKITEKEFNSYEVLFGELFNRNTMLSASTKLNKALSSFRMEILNFNETPSHYLNLFLGEAKFRLFRLTRLLVEDRSKSKKLCGEAICHLQNWCVSERKQLDEMVEKNELSEKLWCETLYELSEAFFDYHYFDGEVNHDYLFQAYRGFGECLTSKYDHNALEDARLRRSTLKRAIDDYNVDSPRKNKVSWSDRPVSYDEFWPE